jgi:photosynthetic reaction center H subunit
MPTGAITGYIDVAQLVLYAFWIFFLGLIFYLRREDKREGYPLWSESSESAPILNFPPMPGPKVFHFHDGETAVVEGGRPDNRPVKAVPSAVWPGAPLVPTGNPMQDGVGPASYAQRADIVETTFEGEPKIVPLSTAHGFNLESRDPNPVGMTVRGADNATGGTVRDVWVDRSEVMIRYLEVEVPTAAGPRRVLLPINFCRIDPRRRIVNVRSILGRQFADVPGHKNPEKVTRQEEERVGAYYAGGTLYATPSRAEPII